MENPFPLHDATLGTGSRCEPLVRCYRTLAAAQITWLCPTPCRSRAHHEPLVQMTYVLWRDALPPAPEPFGSDQLSPAPHGSMSRRRPAGRAPRRWRGSAWQGGPGQPGAVRSV